MKDKICPRCQKWLDESDFYKNDAWCKKCRKAYNKKYNEDNYKLDFKLGIRNISPKGR